MRRLLTVLVAAAGLTVLVAAPAVAAPAPYPAAATCVDTAGALGAATCARITSVLAADEKASPQRDQIAVAVVRTTGGATIEDWSTGLFNTWGVGQRGTDNGVLLVVALDDRALRIATGDGLRTRLPDYRASEIVGGTITPLLRAGRTADAVLAGLDAIRTALGHDTATRPLAAPGTTTGLTGTDLDGTDPLADYPAGDESTDGGGSTAWLWILLLVGVAVAAWISSALRSADGGSWDGDGSAPRRRSYSSPRRSFSSSSSRRSSSSSRRSSGFGGGRSSGGGASGRW